MSRATVRRFALLALWIITFLIVRSWMGHGKPQNDDARIEALLAKPGAIEALSWLEAAPSGTRTIGGGEKEYDHEAALELVRELYRRGAVRVTAIRVVTDRDEEGRKVQYTDTLIVELPDEQDSRQSLFDLDRRETQEEYDSAEEVGQRYFMM